ncbi:MAG: ABC transporter ATP-binding protein [Deltaproteobacteria bacterium]|nr:ABC transporter ATP-binding protein [Deltaproteobacteria bacterium]
MTLLHISDMDTFYGLSHILFEVSLEVKEGETVCLLGRNGVGKTTTMRSIMGLSPARRGNLTFRNESIRGKKSFQIARMGIGFVPEDRIIFPNLTVRENLELGIKSGTKGQPQWTLKRVYKLFPILEARKSQDGATLSGGEQQMLTIARTLMGDPLLLLLDEPCEGLAPLIVKTLGDQIRLLKGEGMTILITEQNAIFALELSERAYILEKGAVVWRGNAMELKERPDIMKKYLGI